MMDSTSTALFREATDQVEATQARTRSPPAAAFRRVAAAFIGEVVTATMRRITSGEIRTATGLSDAEAYVELARLVVATRRR